MSKDLLDEFFERDLSEEELQALRDRLDSEEAALRFSEKARDLHQSLSARARVGTGLRALFARLSSAFEGPLVVRAMAATAGLVLVFAGGVAITLKVLRAQDVFVMTQAPVAAPRSEGLTTHREELRSGQTAPAQPAIQANRQLVIHLTLVEAAMVATEVRTPNGTLVCSLGSLPVDAGVHRLVWNGRTLDGVALSAGRYQVVTHWDGKEVIRWVELRPNSV